MLAATFCGKRISLPKDFFPNKNTKLEEIGLHKDSKGRVFKEYVVTKDTEVLQSNPRLSGNKKGAVQYYSESLYKNIKGIKNGRN